MTGLDSLLGKGAKVNITPSVVASRSWNTFEFGIMLGTGGLARGDSLGIVCGSNIDRWQFQFASHIWGCYTPWQIDDPAAPNFLTVRCSRHNVPLNVRVGPSGGLKPFVNQPDHFLHSLHKRYRYVLEVIPEKPLRKGDTITVTWGDTIWGSPGVMAPAIALSYYFLPFKYSLLPEYDRGLPIRQGNYDSLPCVRVKGKNAVRLHCALQPLVVQGERFRIHCAAIDEYGNLDEDFRGTVYLKVSDRSAEVPEKIVFTSSHKGRRQVNDIRFLGTGWQSIVLYNKHLKSPPHPVLVSREKPRNKIYFGEMHGHTLDDDGTFRAQEHFTYARDVAGLDFCSLGVHAEYFGTQRAWRQYLRVATKAHTPGRFVTFYGYEWAGEGHTNAYFFREQDAVNIYGKCILKGRHPRDDPDFRIPCNKETRFLKLLKSLGCPVFCITHCHSAYVSPVDDTVIRLHEVYSMHQDNPRDRKLQEVLSRGLRIGVVAGSDSHRLPIGSLCPDPDAVWNQPFYIAGHKGSQSIQKKCGIQATFAPSLNRKELWNSMLQRHTYGTTGARIVILFEVDGVQMGEEIYINAGRRPRLRARIGGTARLAEVCVFKYDGCRWSTPLKKVDIGSRTFDLEYEDSPLKRDVLYYLRIRQKDGEQAWTSPIRVKKRLS